MAPRHQQQQSDLTQGPQSDMARSDKNSGGRRLGRLLLVVGPSGAGKDRLISAAKSQLADKPQVHFAIREITRPADAGHENHVAVTQEKFSEAKKLGQYFLSWQAHGLSYGVPASVMVKLLSGIDVVVNTSRSIIAEAKELYPLTDVILITAPKDVLAARLGVRGREAADDIAQRLTRVDVPMSQPATTTIVNDGAFEQSLYDFVATLKAGLKSKNKASAVTA